MTYQACTTTFSNFFQVSSFNSLFFQIFLWPALTWLWKCVILEGFALNKLWNMTKWLSSDPNFVSSKMDISGHQCVHVPRACWPSDKDISTQTGRDGSVGISRTEQHMQKVRMCSGIIIVLSCQGHQEGNLEPEYLPPSTLLGIKDQLMSV